MAITSVTITEPEVIFIELDAEVLFYGQPCGVIVAKTLALANSAAASVEIIYEKSNEQRPIVPSISHWRALDNRDNVCDMSSEQFRFAPNQGPKPFALESSKQIKGSFQFSKLNFWK